MYKICDAKDIDKIADKFRKIDDGFKAREDADYYYICDENEDVFAFCSVKTKDKNYILYDIFVKKDQRYKSYATKLIKFIVNHGAKRNIERVISTLDENIEFLKKKGFIYEKKYGRVVFDNIQTRNQRDIQGKKVVIWSAIQNAFLAAIKIVGGIKGRSKALLSDGINSLSDVATSIGILIGLHYSNKPADDDHPYGHEKIECVISIILGILIIITAFELGKWTVTNYIQNGLTKDKPALAVIALAMISAIVKFFMYRYKIKVGKATNNSALIADGKDSKSDVYSSLSVVAGILLSIYVHPIFDVLVSLIVSILIFKEGISIILETSDIILDKQDEAFIKEIENYIYKSSNIKNVHDIYMKKSGDKIFLSFHIRVPGDISVREAHVIADNIEEGILADYSNVADVTVHMDALFE